jgi:hypothetical protein
MMDCDFDPVGVVVDWLDACRARRLDDLLNLYDERASLRCECEGNYHGRHDVARYWSTRLPRAVTRAFSLTDLAVDGNGGEPRIVLDYVAYNGKPVRIRFQFTEDGKIAETACWSHTRSGLW